MSDKNFSERDPKWPTREEVERLARQKYAQRGGQGGDEMSDWLEAEKELTRILNVTDSPLQPAPFDPPPQSGPPAPLSFLDFYGLREQPFGMTPDPAYLYASRTHSEALASLALGIADTRGFMTLVADPGMGKTTLLYQLMEQLRDSARTVLIFQTECTSREFIEYILQDLGVDTRGLGLVAMHGRLNEILFEQLMQGRRFVLIVDEAQNLDDSVLETVRMLSNFETHNAKLLQIVLAGQPKLASKLAQPALSQLRQRVSVLAHLQPFTVEETRLYIEHRLQVAGRTASEPIFDTPSIRQIAWQSKGIPRNINNICHNALLLAFSRGERTVSAEIVAAAVARLDMEALAFGLSGAGDPVPVALEPFADAKASTPRPAPAARAAAAAADRVAAADRAVKASLTYDPGRKINPSRWHLRSVIGVVVLFSGTLLLALLGRSASRQRLTPDAFNSTSGDLGQMLPSRPAESLNGASYDAMPQETDHGQVLTVAAGPQQSLKDLSIRYLGHFDDAVSAQIRNLNPDLKDPEHLEAGQLIRIPLPPGAMKKVNDTNEAVSSSKQETSGGMFTRFTSLLRSRR